MNFRQAYCKGLADFIMEVIWAGHEIKRGAVILVYLLHVGDWAKIAGCKISLTNLVLQTLFVVIRDPALEERGYAAKTWMWVAGLRLW